MIRLQDMTPDVYYNQSRDFQFIGRLFDIVLNAVKTNTDLIQECPISDNLDNKLIDLVALTLGFKSKHNYNIKQLAALCTTFMKILKNKGSIKSIELALTTLFQAESVDQEFSYDLSEDHSLINIYIPGSLSDINLFKDLLNYILPAGMSTRLIRTYLQEKEQTDLYTVQDNVSQTIIQSIGGSGLLYQETPNNVYGDVLTTDKESIYSNAYIFQGKKAETQQTEPENNNNNEENNQEPEGE